jgi:hypothetical protein
MRSVTEVHHVANINTQSDRTSESFNADTRIKDAECIAGGYAADRPDKAAENPFIRGIEIDKSALECPEDTPRSGTGDQLRTEEPRQTAQTDTVEAGKPSEAGRGRNVALEIVSHLGFELHVTIQVEIDIRSYADRIQIVRIGHTQIIREHADLTVTIRAALVIPLRQGAGAASRITRRGGAGRRSGGLRRCRRRSCRGRGGRLGAIGGRCLASSGGRRAS